MSLSAPKLTWCVVRLGDDYNWWVDEISDEIHWDLDGLSIIDPRQFQHIMDLIDPLRDYGFDSDILEGAFYGFTIQEDLGKKRVKLKRFQETILDSEEQLFVLPDIVDEEKGPYADLIDHLTKLRLELLNDLIDFEQKLTVDELEEEIREQQQNNDFMEGKASHLFDELMLILEYVPEGYQLDHDEDDDVDPKPKKEIEDDFSDVEVEVEENIEEDETMKWDEDEEEEDEDSDSEGEEEEEKL